MDAVWRRAILDLEARVCALEEVVYPHGDKKPPLEESVRETKQLLLELSKPRKQPDPSPTAKAPHKRRRT